LLVPHTSELRFLLHRSAMCLEMKKLAVGPSNIQDFAKQILPLTAPAIFK